jgi:hypothetical protein
MKDQVKYLQELFYELLKDYGRVYIAVRYSENSRIGNRGFTEEEKKQGIILVFNQTNHKTLQWTDEGSIVTTLGFGHGNKPEKCFFHCDDIVSVFSPDAQVRFDRWDMWKRERSAESPESAPASDAQQEQHGKVVSLDKFRKIKP